MSESPGTKEVTFRLEACKKRHEVQHGEILKTYLELLCSIFENHESFIRLFHSKCRYALLKRDSDRWKDSPQNSRLSTNLEYSSLMPGNVWQCVSEDRDMINSQRRYSCHNRLGHNVSAIKCTSHSNFKNCGVYFKLKECMECNQSQEPKVSRYRRCAR
jgi:hypothetical protein